jgi:hypothetical protein
MESTTMTAIEEIDAAIGKLDEQRRGAVPGSWEIKRDDYSPECVTVGGTWLLTRGFSERDAKLIVTLHRTIDAQIAVLEAAKFNIGATQLGFLHATVSAAIRLARAINGTPS